jgi:transposase-like protein
VSTATVNNEPELRQAKTLVSVRIKTRLLERGETIADWARIYGVSRTALSLAVNHPPLFKKWRNKLTADLGL